MRLAKNRNFIGLALGLIFQFIFLESCSSQSEVRNKISFMDSVSTIQDSLKLMTYYLDRINDIDGKNFFFDNEEWFYINNSKVGRTAVGDSINFVPAVQKITGLHKHDSYKFISLALYLRNNHISGGFKHSYFGVYFYNYRRTLQNNNEDQRYILLFDKELRNLKGSEIESYQLIDRKGDLLLIAPAEVKVKK